MKIAEVLYQGPVFRTEKGSIYVVHSDGTTTRNKAPRPEHPGEKERGMQPRSEKTVYVTWDDANQKLSSFQAEGDGVKLLLPLPRSQDECAIWYATGPYKGKWQKSSITKFTTKPAVGLIPVEIFKKGHSVHFGNKIVSINGNINELHFVDLDWSKDMEPSKTKTVKMRNHLINVVKYPGKNVVIGTVQDEHGKRIAAFVNDIELVSEASMIQGEQGSVRLTNPVVKKEYRSKGYGLLMYEHVLDQLKLTLQSDPQQTLGGGVIWALLNRNPRYEVYGVDSNYEKKFYPLKEVYKQLTYNGKSVFQIPELRYLVCKRK